MASPSLVAERTYAAETHDEARLIAALRMGDEAAFCTLVDTYHVQMLRVAHAYVVDSAVADEVVQETWLVCCATSIASNRAPRSRRGSPHPGQHSHRVGHSRAAQHSLVTIRRRERSDRNCRRA